MLKKGLKKYLVFLILVGSLIITIYKQYNLYIYDPIDKKDDTNISFQIKKGQTVKEIGENLEQEGIIRSNTAFYLYVKFNNLGENIIAGRFVLKKTMNIPEIFETISDPSQAEFVITVQEGLTIGDIENKLVELDLIDKEEFIEAIKTFNGWEYYDFLDQKTLSQLEFPIEGYLYPDTYFLDPLDFQPHDLIYLMLDNFEKKLETIKADSESKLKNYSLHEIITMASIIENEVFGEKNRKTVSGILWKRLENNWRLDADTTLLYITDDREITAQDLEIDSPYNTRRFKGLPPGPVSNPSIESINAALYPQESPYWFYLTIPDTGKVIYAETNEEHEKNKETYL